MPNRQDVVNEARKWVGVPWKHQGRTRSGIDCVGLVVLVAKGLDLPHADYTGYTRRAQGNKLVDIFKQHAIQINVKDAVAGDVILLADGQYVCHAAILTDKYNTLHLVHAYATDRAVMEEEFEGVWKSRVRYAFSYRGVE